jgi:hypothetical protein
LKVGFARRLEAMPPIALQQLAYNSFALIYWCAAMWAVFIREYHLLVVTYHLNNRDAHFRGFVIGHH